ncbi:hypothetical protein BKA70DRAFT_1231023 [Coprinopsis sp. MPI-PUGE-AT-0042]|nr:hypothetical protein BKA70DRAFT_1231023 [Coprinopsis sp. MPI-PUGE-AT-0042]
MAALPPSPSPLANATRLVLAPAVAQKLTALCARCGLRGHLTAHCQANLPAPTSSGGSSREANTAIARTPAASAGDKRLTERRTVLIGYTPITRAPGVYEFIPVETIDGDPPTPYTIIHNGPDSFYTPQPSSAVSTRRGRGTSRRSPETLEAPPTATEIVISVPRMAQKRAYPCKPEFTLVLRRSRRIVRGISGDAKGDGQTAKNLPRPLEELWEPLWGTSWYECLAIDLSWLQEPFTTTYDIFMSEDVVLQTVYDRSRLRYLCTCLQSNLIAARDYDTFTYFTDKPHLQ